MVNRSQGLSGHESEVLRHFTATEASTIRIDDVLTLFPGSRKLGSQILNRMAQKGWLQKIGAGVFRMIPLHATIQAPMENPWPVAMDLFKPAFLSGWTAAEHWDLTEQIFNSVSLVTGHPQHPATQTIGGIAFRTKTLPEHRRFGHKSIWTGGGKIEIADPHRLIIDILDDPSFGGGGRHTVDIIREYLRKGECDGSILLDYATRFDKGSVFKRLGFLMEALKAPLGEDWFESCRSHVTKGISELDPGAPKQGRIVSRWNLRINVPWESV
jgi:predicted transcriptional regulator of viral defense system